MNDETERNWGMEPWRCPTINEGETLLYSEYGRIVEKGTYGHCPRTGIDYRSHWFIIVKQTYGPCTLVVKHGGGEERVELLYREAEIALFLDRLDSTERYLLMHTFYKIHSKAKEQAAQATAERFREAFVDGRLKKRKMPKSERHKVWIETKLQPA